MKVQGMNYKHLQFQKEFHVIRNGVLDIWILWRIQDFHNRLFSTNQEEEILGDQKSDGHSEDGIGH
jgi:hypothetical protein